MSNRYATHVRHAEEWEPETALVAALLAIADRIDALVPDEPTTSKLNDTKAMNTIHALLNATEWDADTFERVGEVVEATGRSILDPNEYGTCDTCGAAYELAERDPGYGRCGDCADCADCCQHKNKGEAP